MQDQHWMHIALRLGARGMGLTAPNPFVGCVLVKEGRIIGRGWTQAGGRPHAETMALQQAGNAAKGSTVYVTLEPCSHHGNTPPCVDALIAAGISRCVIAVRDPNPEVSGQGIATLKAAGVDVTTAICEMEATEYHRGFFLSLIEKRPLVTLKIASTLDGCIALPDRESQWITGKKARDYGHLLRSTHDAILIGAQTARKDTPALTCRLPGLACATPTRIILSRGRNPVPRLGLPDASPVWVLHPEGTEPDIPEGTIRHEYETDKGLLSVLEVLAQQGFTRLLVEGGAHMAGLFLKTGLVDEIAWFHAPAIMGEGLGAIADMTSESLRDMPRFSVKSQRQLGEDTLTLLTRKSH